MFTSPSRQAGENVTTIQDVATPKPKPELPELHFASPPEAPEISDTQSGWAALAKSVREIDQNVVQDYKEDIDSILVFAGLYSAVLTGLLAISINNLQQNSNDVMISLLRQLTNQTHSYSFNSGMLNSTAPPPDLEPPPFFPSLAAKRVNMLWFASLMLSLISASFGILVKQWLREFLAGTYSSPEARMRVRHFREPGLRDWKVYGIASTLPLLLQLSLALFFLGLCFFTVDIHHSVGYITVSLAVAWAVLFIAISFAPILSPRCPYKTPVLEHITRFLRQSLYHILDLAFHPTKGVRSSFGRVWDKMPTCSLRCSRKRAQRQSLVTNVQSLSAVKPSEDFTPPSVSSPNSLAPVAFPVPGTSLVHFATPAAFLASPSSAKEEHASQSWQIPPGWTWRLLACDEENVASVPTNDIDALITLDEMQRDDRLLHKICSVLEERHTSLAATLDFVLKIIASRMPRDWNLPPRPISPTQIVDLTMLPPQICVILVDTLAKALSIVVRKVEISEKIDWTVPEMKESLALLCARLPCLLSNTVNEVLLLCCSGHYTNRTIPFMDALTLEAISTENCFVLGLHLQEILRPMMLQLDSETFESHVRHLSYLYCNCGSCVGAYSRRIVNHRRDMGPILENHLMKLVLEHLQQQTKIPNAQWLSYHSNMLTFLHNAWGFSKNEPWQDVYISCLPQLLIHPTIGPAASSLFYHHTSYSSVATKGCTRAFKVYLSSRENILSAITKSLVAYIEDFYATKPRIHPFFLCRMLQFLAFQLSLISWLVVDDHEGSGWFTEWFQPLWQKMFRVIAPAFHICLAFPNLHAKQDEIRLVVAECLEHMGKIDAEWEAFLAAGSIVAPAGDSLFDDDIVDVVCKLAAQDKVDSYMQARRKRGSRAESTLSASVTDGSVIRSAE